MDRSGTAPIEVERSGYSIIGKGEPTIMLPGYSLTRHGWPLNLIRELTKTRLLILLDYRGVGDSEDDGLPFTMTDLADDVFALSELLGIESFDVIGYSMGSNVAQELMLRNPGKVRRAVFIAGDPGGDDAIPPDEESLRILADSSGNPEDIGRRMLQTMFTDEWLTLHPDPREYMPTDEDVVSPGAMARQYEAMENWQGALSRLKDVEVPTLMVCGDLDRMAPLENSRMMAEEMPMGELIIAEGCGHGLPYQRPEWLARTIEGFFGSVLGHSRH